MLDSRPGRSCPASGNYSTASWIRVVGAPPRFGEISSSAAGGFPPIPVTWEKSLETHQRASGFGESQDFDPRSSLLRDDTLRRAGLEC